MKLPLPRIRSMLCEGASLGGLRRVLDLGDGGRRVRLSKDVREDAVERDDMEGELDELRDELEDDSEESGRVK